MTNHFDKESLFVSAEQAIGVLLGILIAVISYILSQSYLKIAQSQTDIRSSNISQQTDQSEKEQITQTDETTKARRDVASMAVISANSTSTSTLSQVQTSLSIQTGSSPNHEGQRELVETGIQASPPDMDLNTLEQLILQSSASPQSINSDISIISAAGSAARARRLHQTNHSNSSPSSSVKIPSMLITDEIASDDLMSLLGEVARDHAMKDGYVHRGITCNMCHVSPIRGVRYKCGHCLDFDICERCEMEVSGYSQTGTANSAHPRTHIFLKIRIPIPPLSNPRSALLSGIYAIDTGIDTTATPNQTYLPSPEIRYSTLKELQKATHFDQIEIKALYEQFKTLLKPKEDADTAKFGIDKRTFLKCLGPLALLPNSYTSYSTVTSPVSPTAIIPTIIRSTSTTESEDENLILQRIFDFYDKDGDGLIDFSELVTGLSVLCKGTAEERAIFAFKGYDTDKDGYISKRELRKMYNAYFNLSTGLLRDVVRGFEMETMLEFDDQIQDRPVSAAFNAPIPETLTSPTSTGTYLNAEKSPVSPNSAGFIGLTQKAIDEMVTNTFQAIKEMKQNSPNNNSKKDLISFDEFLDYAKMDSKLVSWFEALGTVF